MSGEILPPLETRKRQTQASAPESSAFVRANAGSGKTYVLAQRAIRLMLRGCPPARLVCLTYTKAAAAEMADRVFKILAKWTLLDDAALCQELHDLEGAAPSPGLQTKARRLFASALETPGGLKIQTIHSFCEALLHQFPLEAKVPPHFRTDEQKCNSLLEEAKIQELARAAQEGESSQRGRDYHLILARLSNKSIHKAIGELIAQPAHLRHWIDDASGAEATLHHILQIDRGFEAGSAAERIRDESLFSVRQARLSGAQIDQHAGKLNEQQQILLNARDDQTYWQEDWHQIFFTQKGAPRKSLLSKTLREALPELAQKLDDEQQRLITHYEQVKRYDTAAITLSLARIAHAIIKLYENLKWHHGLLDYDDLIMKAAFLLQDDEATRWVQYKLDFSIDHILVDEAQDTSPDQWRVIAGLGGEFFAGESARDLQRTLFAVGDEKQSIYSFQGARPAFFAEMGRSFADRARDMAKNFHEIELNLSFRSLPAILDAVDQIFSLPEAAEGLTHDNDPPIHETLRSGDSDSGEVALWPLIAPDSQEPALEWYLPLDHQPLSSPQNRLAEQIAGQIDKWRSEDGVDPGDVLVLVRKRTNFVEALMRALKRRQIDFAGRDRFELTAHIAIKDLLALARFLLLPQDDLSLAALLRSPLFDCSYETLFHLARPAPETKRSGSLWQALEEYARSSPAMEKIAICLKNWQTFARTSSAFDSFMHVLTAGEGRQKFHARFGPEIDDVLEEFLSALLKFERDGGTDLQGFVEFMEQGEISLRREVEQSQGRVRILTIHGAKGLEAKHVILVDSAGEILSPRHYPQFLPLHNDEINSAGYVFLPKLQERTDWHERAIKDHIKRAGQEYRRLLYVAMTRARDRLIICGYRGARDAPRDCWHSLVQNAFAAVEGSIAEDKQEECLIWRGKNHQISRVPLPVFSQSAGKTNHLSEKQLAEKQLAENHRLDASSDQLLANDDAPLPPWLTKNASLPSTGQEGEIYRPSQIEFPDDNFVNQTQIDQSFADTAEDDQADFFPLAPGLTPDFMPPGDDARAQNPSDMPDKLQIKSEFKIKGELEIKSAGNALPPLPPALRGKVIHALLEHLPRFVLEKRAAHSRRIIADHLPASLMEHGGALEREVAAILDNAEFAALFSGKSLCEVPVSACLSLSQIEEIFQNVANYGTQANRRSSISDVKANGAMRRVIGIIDRLVLREQEILIVDYKTTRHVPANKDALSAKIGGQIMLYRELIKQLYPGREIRCLILWTAEPKLMEL